MYYVTYQSTRDSREIIVETFSRKELREVQKIIIEAGYVITLMIGAFMFKAIKEEKEDL